MSEQMLFIKSKMAKELFKISFYELDQLRRNGVVDTIQFKPRGKFKYCYQQMAAYYRCDPLRKEKPDESTKNCGIVGNQPAGSIQTDQAGIPV